MKPLEILTTGLLLLVAASATAKSKDATPAALSRNGQIYLGLAQSYLAANRLEDALERAKRAVASDPNYGETHALLGMIYLRTGQRDLAGPEFERALHLAPGSGSILNAHAVWMCEQGQFDQADLEFRQALADPFYTDPGQANFNAGRCSQKAGKPAVAEAYLRQALDKSPNEPDVLLMLARVELEQGKWLEARAFVQRRLAIGATAEALDLAAKIEDAAGDAAAAARYRQQRNEQFPDVAPTGEEAHKP
jgi:type IV pilus assembly protein PilF